METKNTLKTAKEVKSLIDRGYGFVQMLDKLQATSEELASLSTEVPEIATLIMKRYGIALETMPEEPKKRTRKQASKVEENRTDDI